MKPCIFLLTLLLLLPAVSDRPGGPTAWAAEWGTEEESTILPAGRTVDGPYFAAGELVEISGTVNGDVYAAGGQVVVNGVINGDLLAAGGMVSVSGTVTQDARLAGGQVVVSGEISQNLTAAGGTLELTSTARLGGSLVAAAGTARVAAPVAGEVYLAGEQVVVAERLGGNLHTAAERLRLTSGAAVAGDLVYWSEEVAILAPGATVSGTIRHRVPPEPSSGQVFGVYWGFKLALILVNFLSTLVLGLLLLHFLPGFSRRAAERLSERPLVVLGLGLLILVAVPLLAVILAATVAGLPLAGLLLAWFGLALYLARILPLLWLGGLIARKLGKADLPKTSFLLGLIIYYLLILIPFSGMLLTPFTIIAGLGLLLLAQKEWYLNLRQQEPG